MSTKTNHSLYYTAKERNGGVKAEVGYRGKGPKKVLSDKELVKRLKPYYNGLRIPSISKLEDRIKEVEARRGVGKPGEQKNPEDELLPAIDSIIQARVTAPKRLAREGKRFDRQLYSDIVHTGPMPGTDWTDTLETQDPTKDLYRKLLKERARLSHGIPGPKRRLDNLARTLLSMGLNAFDITFGKEIVDGWNKKTMKSLKPGDQAYILLHGTSQNGGAFRERIKQLEAEGYKVFAPSYSYSDALANLDSAADWLHGYIKGIKGKTKVAPIVEGHSLGAILAKYGSMQRHYTSDDVRRVVLDSGVFEGTSDTWQKKLLEGIESNIQNVDPRHRKGRETMLYLSGVTSSPYKRRRTNTEVITVAGTGDRLVNPGASFHPDARQNYLVPEGTHFDGAGGNRAYGTNIIHLVKAQEKAGWGFKDYTPENKIYEKVPLELKKVA